MFYGVVSICRLDVHERGSRCDCHRRAPVSRLRDAKLQRAAESVLGKLAVVVPEPLQTHLVSAPIYVSDGDAPPVVGVDPAVLRDAIHDARKVSIAYIDEQGRCTRRTI